MFSRVAWMGLALLCCLPFTASAQPFAPNWPPHVIETAESFEAEDKIVGTHYFYWYDYPHHHFFDNAERTDDALQDHFPNPESVSYNSTAWHRKQIDDCMAAGLDFIMPVYWGVVDNYFRPGLIFSVQGLGPLQRALEERQAEGLDAPKIGLFYDTSTLLPGIRGERGRSEKYDLTTPEGQDIFYRTIRDFFHQVHPRHWAMIDGQPLVVLYGSGFAKSHGQSTFDYVVEQFQEDFHGLKPYIVRDASWNAQTDAVTAWGAALGGPNIYDTVAQIGPGYNDMAVPGRSTPIRDREGGNYYRWSWNQVLDSSANIVLIETWNEMHEGTTICETVEYGRQYIELTRLYVDRFKQGLPAPNEITLRHPNPLPRPASDEGQEYADQQSVSIDFTRSEPSEGIWLVRGQPDGPVRSGAWGGQSAIRTAEADTTYMYFNIADPFAFDLDETVTVRYTYWDDGYNSHLLEYDSNDASATLNGAYTATPPVQCEQSGEWVTRTVTLEDARFVNRQNGGSDLRFAVRGGWLAIRDLAVVKKTAP